MGGREVAFFVIDILSMIIEWYMIVKQVIWFFCFLGTKRSLADVKFYILVNNFSLENMRKTILKKFQLLAKFCNAKVDKQIADAV